MTALLLIKPCNISPRLLFVPARQLMSPTLSQRETKAQRTRCTLRSLRPWCNWLEESCVSKMTGLRSHWGQKQKNLNNHHPLSSLLHLTWIGPCISSIHVVTAHAGQWVSPAATKKTRKRDLDKLYHHQLTKWSAISGQMRHSSPAAAVIHHTRGDECWITTHPV